MIKETLGELRLPGNEISPRKKIGTGQRGLYEGEKNCPCPTLVGRLITSSTHSGPQGLLMYCVTPKKGTGFGSRMEL